MRLFTTILLLLLFMSVKGQSVKESFINDVYKSIVDTAALPYRLSEQSAKFFNHKAFSSQLDEDLKTHTPVSVRLSLMKNMEKDTANQHWQQGLLTDAILLNSKQVDTLLGQVINILSVDKGLAKHKKKESVLKDKTGSVYFFSNPVFDSTGEYALIQVTYACGNACGKQCLVLFQKVNGLWMKTLETSCGLS